MFGFVVANQEALSPQAFERYRGCYCGLCEAIRRRHGAWKGMTLTYDLALLPLLLGALYTPPEQSAVCACMVHPLKKRLHWQNCYTAYAADMNVILFYYKLMDDWHDERAVLHLAAARTLKGSCARVEGTYPRQCRAIRECLAQISRVEQEGSNDLDAAAHWFGVLLGELFWLQEDAHAETLRQLGYFLGKFIYLQDASLDLRKDLKKERYNPLAFAATADHTPLLTALIGEASARLEQLPLARDEDILHNIFYSGVWCRYRMAQAAARQKAQRTQRKGQDR